MPDPRNPLEHALVIQALTSGMSNCIQWVDANLLRRVRSDPDLRGLESKTIREDVIIKARTSPREVIQVVETRPNYKNHFNFYYKVLLDYDNLPYRIFVEPRLNDDDPKYPAVAIVNVHRQRS